MATMLALYNADGCIGRCDTTCYNAVGPRCHCMCGGTNHGVGLDQALRNTTEGLERIGRAWKAAHPDEHDLRIITHPMPPPPEPLALWPNWPALDSPHPTPVHC